MAPFLPKISRKPTDEWSVREKLALASAVIRCGDNNWASVSRLIRPLAEPSRPSDWVSQKNAALQYSDLLENLEIPKRKRGERVDNNDTPANLIARKLRIQRIEQLQKLIQEEQQMYREKKDMLSRLERGELDSQLPHLVRQAKEAQQQRQEAEQAHQRWLQEREATKPRKEPTSPLLTSLLSNANPTLSKLLEMPLVEDEPPPPPAPDIVPEPPSPVPSVQQEVSPAVVVEEPVPEEATILEVVQPVEVEVASVNEEAPEEVPLPSPTALEEEETIPVPSPSQEETVVEASPQHVEIKEEVLSPSEVVPIPEELGPVEESKPVEEEVEEPAPVEEPPSEPLEPPSKPEPPAEFPADLTPVATPCSPGVEEEVSLPESKQEDEPPPEEKPPATPKVAVTAASTKKAPTSRRRGRPPKTVEATAELSLVVESVPNSPSFASEDPELTKEYKTWKKAIMLVWNSAANHKFANTFLHPVTEDVAPGYHHIVLRPMDLSLIKKNIETGVVRTTLEVERDMLIMFQNAIMYNSSDHDVYTMSKQMQAEVLKDIQNFKATQMMLQGSEHKVLRCRKTEEEEGGGGHKRKRSSVSEDSGGPKKRRARLE